MLLFIRSSTEVASGTFRYDVVKYVLWGVHFGEIPVLNRIWISLIDDCDVFLWYNAIVSTLHWPETQNQHNILLNASEIPKPRLFLLWLCSLCAHREIHTCQYGDNSLCTVKVHSQLHHPCASVHSGWYIKFAIEIKFKWSVNVKSTCRTLEMSLSLLPSL